MLLIGFTTNCQDPYHKIYTIEDGLPSNELYEVYFDDNNLMWITTDRGICKYDSYEFTTYSTKDGLAYPTNFSIFPDEEGRLWFTGYDGSLTILEDGVFRPYEYNTKLKKEFKDNDFCAMIGFDEENTLHAFGYIQIYYYELSRELITVSAEGEVQSILKPKQEIACEENTYRCLKKLDFKNASFYDFGETRLQNKGLVELDDGYLFAENIKFSALSKDNYSILYLVKDNEIQQILKGSYMVSSIYVDDLGGVFISTSDGLIYVKDINNINEKKWFFKNEFVSSLNQDKEGNYWMTTRSGLFFIPTFSFEEFDTNKDPIKSFKKLNGSLFYIKGSSKVCGIDKETLEDSIFFTGEKGFYNLFADDYSINTLEAKFVIKTSDVDSGLDLFVRKQLSSGFSFDFWLLDNKEYELTGLPHDLANFSCYNYGQSCYFLRDDSDENYWYGDLKGLKKYEIDPTNLIKDVGELVPAVRKRISGLLFDSRSRLWVSTLGEGVSCIVNDSQLVLHITEEDGLVSNLINDIYLENDSILWLSTNKGLNKVELNFHGDAVKDIKLIESEDGLLSNYINTFSKWQGRYWIGTNYGLSSIDTSHEFGVQYKPNLIITQVAELKANVVLQDSVVLDYDQNDIKFNYTGVTYRKPNIHNYFYRIRRNNEWSKWATTNDRSLTFNNLDWGEYCLEIRTRNKYDVSSEISSFNFTIRPHFTETYWFYGICFIGLVLIFVLINRYRVKLLKRKFEEENRLSALILKKDIAELSTFRNQFNPHFVFNFLNSIQSNLFEGDIRTANFYLSKFSKLIREGLVLMNADLITIERELKYISDYLELEMKRFPNKFSFVINSDDLPIDMYLIPPLLIQPIIENILKHAFSVNSGGTVIIELSEVDANSISIRISDNGKGVRLDSDKDKRKEGSFGLKITRDRINLLNLHYPDSKASFTLHNNTDENCGTTAVFVLPKIENDA